MIYRAAMLGAAGSAFSPLDISGLQLWLDASDTSTITESSGAVSQWDDKSGNGNHVSQGTAAEQPATGTRTHNGRNVIDFDGNDALSNGSYSRSQPWTVFAVHKFDTSGSQNRIVYANYSGGADAGNVEKGSDDQYDVFAGAAGGLNIATANTSTRVVSVCFNGAGSSARLDGAALSVGDLGSRDPTDIWVGGRNGVTTERIDGFIAEVLVYDGELASDDWDSAEAYLAGRWGVTLS